MKRISLQYILFLGVLTLVILTSQILIQKAISDSITDSRIINISGRQRMLSQKMTKIALKLSISNSKKDFDLLKTELVAASQLFEDSHFDLQNGNAELDVSAMNKSAALQKLFLETEPYFKAILDGANGIGTIDFVDLGNLSMSKRLVSHVEKIKSNEATFLTLMNNITFEYDRKASEKVASLSSSEYVLFGITLLLIILEAIFIFRPILKTTQKREGQIEDLHDYVQQSIRMFGKNEMEKEQIVVKMTSAEQKNIELSQLNAEMENTIASMFRTQAMKESSFINKQTELIEINEAYKNRIEVLTHELERKKVVDGV